MHSVEVVSLNQFELASAEHLDSVVEQQRRPMELLFVLAADVVHREWERFQLRLELQVLDFFAFLQHTLSPKNTKADEIIEKSLLNVLKFVGIYLP